MQTKITSTSNPKIKHLALLQKSNQKRKKEKVFLIEGAKEIIYAAEAGFNIKEVYIYPSVFLDTPLLNRLEKALGQQNIFNVSKEVYEKLAYREGINGILAVAEIKEKKLSTLTLSEKPLILVLNNIEKPGNLGAILRTADATKVDAVIVCDASCDIFNPNVIRSSVGCVFFTNIVQAEKEETIEWLKAHKINTFAASLKADIEYTEPDYTEATAFIMGSEALGLPEEWLNATDRHIKIPMLGHNDSLNVSTSTAVLAYEVLRQRKK